MLFCRMYIQYAEFTAGAGSPLGFSVANNLSIQKKVMCRGIFICGSYDGYNVSRGLKRWEVLAGRMTL